MIHRLRAAVAAVLLASIVVAPAAAAPPANDTAAGAVLLTGLPSSIVQDTTEATVGDDDAGCGAEGDANEATVWYRFEATEDAFVEIDARPSDYFVGINLFAGAADDDHWVDCNEDFLQFDVVAGETYYLMFADINGDGVNGGNLDAELRVAPPPPTAAVELDPVATVDRQAGAMRLTGTLTCDREADFAILEVAVRQVTGRFYTVGESSDSFPCGPEPTDFAILVFGSNAAFVGGRASVEIGGFACSGDSCTEIDAGGEVRATGGTLDIAAEAPKVGPAPGAVAPANDAIETATEITTLPYSDTLDTTGATADPISDPGWCFEPEIDEPATVWYRYTAAETGSLVADTFGSDYDTTLSVGTSDGAGGIDVITCGDDTRTQESAVRFDAIAGETYYFVVAASPFAGENGGNLVFNLDIGPPEQVVDLEVDAVGTFDPDGTATVTGTYSCVAEAPLGGLIIVELTQRVGNRFIQQTEFLEVDCPASEMPFEVELVSRFGKFLGGPTTAQVIFTACAPWGCANETVDLRITLKR